MNHYDVQQKKRGRKPIIFPVDATDSYLSPFDKRFHVKLVATALLPNQVTDDEFEKKIKEVEEYVEELKADLASGKYVC